MIYFETVRGDLVPVKLLESRRYDSKLRIIADHHEYPKGYEFYTSNLFIVQKVGKFVRPLTAPQRAYEESR